MHDDTANGAALIAAARDFQPRIIAQRDAIETSRRLPGDLARDLARAGFFRIFLPAAYGGLDLTPMDGIAVFDTRRISIPRSAPGSNGIRESISTSPRLQHPG